MFLIKSPDMKHSLLIAHVGKLFLSTEATHVRTLLWYVVVLVAV